MPNIFVGGPIKLVLSSAGFNSDVKAQVSAIHSIVQDMGYDLSSAHLDEDWGDSSEDYVDTCVAQRDFTWMQRCDLFIAILPGEESGLITRTDGTHVELGWASAMGKPTLILTDLFANHSFLTSGLSALTRAELLHLPDVMTSRDILVTAIRRLLG